MTLTVIAWTAAVGRYLEANTVESSEVGHAHLTSSTRVRQHAVDLRILLTVTGPVNCAGDGALGTIGYICAQAGGRSNQDESRVALVACFDIGGSLAVGQESETVSIFKQVLALAGDAT